MEFSTTLNQLPRANLRENCMPKRHEYECARFSMNPRKRKTFEQPCRHKSYGMIFQDLPIGVALVLAPKYTIRGPKRTQMIRFLFYR